MPFVHYMRKLILSPCHLQFSPKDAEDPYLIREIADEREVFHINDQLYTYPEAKCKCRSYGAELATKQNMIDAFNRGADWCSYGWTEGQRAYYPTQKWRAGCGWRRGLNGGYFANPNIRFGANCYGVRPAGEVINRDRKKKHVCRDLDMQKKRSDVISPFNAKWWSAYKQ